MSLLFLPLGSKNGGRRVRPAWEWGRLAQSGRLSAACSGWRTVVTQVRAPSSQSRPPSGRDGTRAHPEQPAWPCQGPRDLRSCGSQQGVSCMLCLLAGWSGGEKRVDLVPHANSGPRVGKTRSAQVTARKTGQSVMGSVFLAHSHCRSWLCGGVGRQKPCLFRSICPLPLISVRPVLCMWGVTGSLV